MTTLGYELNSSNYGFRNLTPYAVYQAPATNSTNGNHLSFYEIISNNDPHGGIGHPGVQGAAFDDNHIPSAIDFQLAGFRLPWFGHCFPEAPRGNAYSENGSFPGSVSWDGPSGIINQGGS